MLTPVRRASRLHLSHQEGQAPIFVHICLGGEIADDDLREERRVIDKLNALAKLRARAAGRLAPVGDGVLNRAGGRGEVLGNGGWRSEAGGRRSKAQRRLIEAFRPPPSDCQLPTSD